MLETSARLLRLLGLLQLHRDWSGPALADRLGVTARTVRRDVDKLRALGYPIDAIGGVGGGYRLAAGTSLPPLLLDNEEAVAVAVGLRTAASGTVTGIAESSVRALAKLDQVLPSSLRHQVTTLSEALVTMPAAGVTVDASLLTALAAAIRDHERLRFFYNDQPRDAEPYRLVQNGRRWYLFGWDTDKTDWRTFRVDKMTVRTPNGKRFTPRPLPADDIAEYMALGITTNQYRYQAVFLMQGTAQAVADEIPSTIGVVEPVDATTCLLRCGSDSLDQLAVWIAACGFEFTVQEPPELADHIRTLAARLKRAVGKTV